MFKPLHDHILVRPVKRLQSRIIDVISNEKYSRGQVIAVGPGERLKRKNGQETGHIRPMQLKVGDWVTMENHGAYGAYSEGGVDYWIMQEKDVAFIYQPEEQNHAA